MRGCFPSADTEDREPGGAGERGGFMGDLLDFLLLHTVVAANLCPVRDGEGAGAAGSGPDWERRPGGEIVEWEEGNPGVRLRIHSSAQPPEVRGGVGVGVGVGEGDPGL